MGGFLEKEDLTEGGDDEHPLVMLEAKAFLPPPPPPPPTPDSDHLPVAEIIEAVTVWARAAPAPAGKPMVRCLTSFGGGDAGTSSSLCLPLASPPVFEQSEKTRVAVPRGSFHLDKAVEWGGGAPKPFFGLTGGSTLQHLIFAHPSDCVLWEPRFLCVCEEANKKTKKVQTNAAARQTWGQP